MEPPEIDLLTLYGRKDIFNEKLRKGYAQVAFGKGEIVDGESVVLWVFYHPDGRICTYEFRKTEAAGGRIIHEMPFGEKYTSVTFAQYIEQHRIHLGEKFPLAEFLQRWQLHGSEPIPTR